MSCHVMAGQVELIHIKSSPLRCAQYSSHDKLWMSNLYRQFGISQVGCYVIQKTNYSIGWLNKINLFHYVH